MHTHTLCGTCHCLQLKVSILQLFESSFNLELTKHCTDQNKLSSPTEEDAMEPYGNHSHGAVSIEPERSVVPVLTSMNH